MVFKESQINSTLVLNNMLTKNCIDDPMPSYTIFLIIVLSRIVALEMCYTASMFNWWTPWALTQSYFSNIFPKKFSLQVGVWVCLALCKSIDCSRQAPLSMGFSRQEYRCGLPFPPPGDLPDSGIKPMSLESPALAGRFFTPAPSGKPSYRTTSKRRVKNLAQNWTFIKLRLWHPVPSLHGK